MNWTRVGNSWQQTSDRIRMTWGKLSDADIAAINGDRAVLATMLQDRYRFGETKVEQMINNFTERLGTATAGLRGGQ